MTFPSKNSLKISLEVRKQTSKQFQTVSITHQYSNDEFNISSLTSKASCSGNVSHRNMMLFMLNSDSEWVPLLDLLHSAVCLIQKQQQFNNENDSKGTWTFVVWYCYEMKLFSHFKSIHTYKGFPNFVGLKPSSLVCFTYILVIDQTKAVNGEWLFWPLFFILL